MKTLAAHRDALPSGSATEARDSGLARPPADRVGLRHLSLSILTHARPATLLANLRQLAPLFDELGEVIVVDNDPAGTAARLVALEFPAVRALRTGRNLGAVGRNAGMRSACGEIVITLDDDVFGLCIDDCRRIADRFAADPRLGAVVFRSLHHATRRTCNWCHHCKPEDHDRTEFRTYEICEGTVAFRKTALEQAGYYWEPLFMSHEGLDLACRITSAGYTVLYDGGITLVHHLADGGRTSWRRYYFDTRNQFWVALRNMPWRTAIGYLARGQTTMLIYALRDGQLRYWLRAVRDAAAGWRQAYRSRQRWSPAMQAVYDDLNRARAPFLYLVRRRLFRRGIGI
ncbi:MAG: glycosyltransferase [Candidatus Krumholzibacteriia bacterium]